MSHNGTVFCGYCGERGHNRRTCKHLKAKQNEIIAKNPDGMYAKQVQAHRARKTTIKCSYCGHAGHNRRTCELLKADRSVVQNAFTAYRKKFADYIKQKGFGIGTIVRVPYTNHRTCDTYVVGMITSMNWSSVTHLYGSTGLYGNHISPAEARFAKMQIIKIVDGSDKRNTSLYTNRPLRVGQRIPLSVRCIADSLPEMFPKYLERIQSKMYGVEWSSQILAPAAFVKIPDDYYNQELTESANRTYRFTHVRGAADYEKQRVSQTHGNGTALWEDIYRCSWQPKKENNNEA